MEAVWNKEILELTDRIMSITAFNREQISLIAQGLQPCSRVLDLCTGYGNLAKVLIDQGKTVYGLDIGKESLIYATQKAGRLIPIKGDVRKLPFNGCFDGVSCASSLGFKELDCVVEGIYRALNPGGFVAITGVESAEQERGINILGLELLKAYEEGTFKMTMDEAQKVVDFVPKISGGGLDSSHNKIEAFERHKLHIKRRIPFNQDTAYFILAQKEEGK